jgi:hypothetical protein
MKETLRIHNCIYRADDRSIWFRVSFFIGRTRFFKDIAVPEIEYIGRQQEDRVFAYDIEIALRRKYSAGIKPPYSLRNFLIERL